MKLLYKLGLALFIFVVLLAQNVFAKDIKFVQITDSHFSTTGEGYSQREVEGSKKFLTDAIKDINSLSDIDFVIFTGDNIDKANPEELKKFLTLANTLKFPYYVVIGNHEVFKSQDLDKKEYLKIVSKYSKNCRTKSPNYVFFKKGVVFIVVDGAKEVIPGPAGYYKKDTLKWLDKQLKKYKNCDVVIFQHFPLIAPCYNRSHTTYNVDDYFEVLNKHSNVIAIFSGHYHANGEKMSNGIYHVSTPALVEPPHNYKIVDIVIKGKKDHKIFTQLRHASEQDDND